MSKAAVIDIGSNTIRYMEADTRAADALFPKLIAVTRLAEGLINTGRLSKESIARSLDAIKGFAGAANSLNIPIFAYATSAVRDAANGDEFVELIKYETGLCTDVLSGKREAEYAYAGATSGKGGLLDIGGGSLQLVNSRFAYSFPLGCVRLKDAANGGISPQSFFAGIDVADCFFAETKYWTGVGGSVTTLAAFMKNLDRYEPELVHGAVLNFEDVLKVLQSLEIMGDERKNHPIILCQRHDIIVYGAMILRYVMETGNIDKITVSVKDGMEGYLSYIAGSEAGAGHNLVRM
ncbi:MAG: Guanosine-5'-triphosphate,3'-diphosphate pyrophosphatase [Firmicutes bacterium ADurb.Bin182]|nr:MAG: Guanosine-5'-triphosphate,3'-diphosphate pyrophosphatase [Firmicutes bacterium ADurb.Bin182]